MYVGITSNLEAEVSSRIRAMKDAELAELKAGDLQLTGSESWLDTVIWGRYAHLKPQMPREWMVKSERINFLYVKHRNTSTNMLASLAHPYWFPPGTSGYGHVGVDCRKVEVADMIADPKIIEHLDKLFTLNQLEEKWSGIQRQVIDFLRHCKSLNEALKLWPQLSIYIPEHRLAQVNEKRAKEKHDSSAALEKLKSIDTEGLTAAAVGARISGAKV